MQTTGILLVVSGPSGVGKGTICSYLLKQSEELQYSVSVTTRQPRPGEQDGINYHFVSKEQFLNMRDQGDLLEWAEVFGNFYGTPRGTVLQSLEQGKDVILEIDIQGALQVKASYPECVTVFVWPPSTTELERRIKQRGTEDEAALVRRLQEARKEMAHVVDYDYVVVNRPGLVEQAVQEIHSIVRAEKAKVRRQAHWLRKALQEVDYEC